MFSTEVAQAINALIEGANLANKRGAFSLSEASNLHLASEYIVSESNKYQQALDSQQQQEAQGDIGVDEGVTSVKEVIDSPSKNKDMEDDVFLPKKNSKRTKE